ncbi:MAG: hypothetical protein R6U20_04010 [Longimonas sp.]|uniref:hypothetical protein n=1 Tax=Longimonas sp. TaxID=2039626 RepID=UPI003974C06F
MMHFVRVLLIALLLTLGSLLPAWGQSAGDGSIYSRFGVGELQSFSSSQAQALGGGGVALRSLNYTNFSNPALWSDQVLTRAEIGARFQTIESTSGQGGDSRLTAGTFDGVQFSVPLLRQKLGVAFGFVPVSRSNFRSEVQRTTSSSPFEGEELDYQVEFLGRGGLQKITGGAGYRFNDALSVGGSLDYIFGTLESQRRTSFPTGNLQEAVATEGVRLTALTATIGSHLTLSDQLRDDDNLMIGAAFTLPTTLSGERTRTIGESLDRDTLSTGVTDGDFDMPWSASVGVAYVPSEALTLTVNGSYAPWGEAESSLTTGGETSFVFPAGGPETLTDRWTMSSGVEWRPAGDDSFQGFLARTGYRLGVSYEQLYVSPDKSTTLNAVEARLGISLPTSISGTRIDLMGNVGRQGTTSQGLVQDTYYGVSARVSIGERWFQQRRLR